MYRITRSCIINIYKLDTISTQSMRVNHNFHSMRCLNSSSKNHTLPDDLSQLMHGRKNRERRDSVTTEILEDRRAHQDRLKSDSVMNRIQLSLVKALERSGLGVKKRRNQVFSGNVGSQISQTSHKTLTGAGGFAVHLTSAAGDQSWPVFEHVLPEVAFAGHSNSGKSTLVNAIAGLLPRKGPASVSDRAGWTDLICFYQLGKKPPVLILADMPGYGHAVASSLEKKQWKMMIKDYVKTRIVLSLCCVLVDSTRGLCEDDMHFLKFLEKNQINWQIILTKSDLLTVEELAACVLVIQDDLQGLGVWTSSNNSPGEAAGTQIDDHNDDLRKLFGKISPVSAATGAGIQNLWKDLVSCIQASTRSSSASPPSSSAVKEHYFANTLRKNKVNEDRASRQ